MVDVSKAVGAWLQAGTKNLELESGHVENLPWMDEELITDEDDNLDLPHGRFLIRGSRQSMPSRPGPQREVGIARQDSFTFESGTLTYDATHKDVKPGTSVVADDSGTVFVEGTDYEVIAGPGYEDTLTRLSFIGATPAPGAGFTWDYESIHIEHTRLGKRIGVVTLTVRATDTDLVGPSLFQPAPRMARSIGEALERFLLESSGKDLSSGGGGELVVGPYNVIGNIPLRKGETVASWVVEVDVAHRLRPVTLIAERARRTDPSLDPTA